MSDRWTDRLSEYLDGELSPDEVRGMEAHLPECGECREILADLRRVTERASRLRDAEPPAELWAGIAERIRAEPPEIQVVSLFDAKRARRRVSFSIPQLLAAGLVLALASAGSVWLALRGGDPAASLGGLATAPAVVVTGTPSAPELRTAPHTGAGPESHVGTGAAGPEPSTRDSAGAAESERRERSGPGAAPSRRRAPARALPRGEAAARFAGSSDPAYDAAVTDLQRVLEQGRDRLDPRTVQALEESLLVIDGAIADARRALAADPANTQLNTYLAGTMQRKLDVLRQASDLVTTL